MWIASSAGPFSIRRGWSIGGPISCSCGAQAASSSGRRMNATHLASMTARSFAAGAPPRQLQEDVFEVGFDGGEVDDVELAGAHLVEDIRDLRLGRAVAQLQLMG